MITEEQTDLIVERLINRIEQANTYFLMKLGASIGQIRELTPTQAQQLVQILKYGGNYEEVIRELAKYTNLNIADIDEIFRVYAEKDLNFAEKFYKYRNIPFTPFEQNIALKTQTQALANIVKNEMFNFTRANVLGYTIKDINGRAQFMGLRETYNRVLDEALLNINQGKESFNSAMSNIMKEIGGSGLKTIQYESGRAVRLDSVVSMHLHDGLRTLHNENQKIIGEQFGYNGIEVTHHANAAPDHIDTVDGKQFALIDRIQEQIIRGTEKEIKEEDIRGNQVWVKGKMYDDFNAINYSLQRQVSTLNCKHTTFSIILGVSKPEYTQEELDADKEKNLQGFDLDGKHYSLYEGTQLQRQLERKIRQQKDIQILAKASGTDDLVGQAQQKITQYTQKYKELSDISGLPTQLERLRVAGYRRKKVK